MNSGGVRRRRSLSARRNGIPSAPSDRVERALRSRRWNTSGGTLGGRRSRASHSSTTPSGSASGQDLQQLRAVDGEVRRSVARGLLVGHRENSTRPSSQRRNSHGTSNGTPTSSSAWPRARAAATAARRWARSGSPRRSPAARAGARRHAPHGRRPSTGTGRPRGRPIHHLRCPRALRGV